VTTLGSVGVSELSGTRVMVTGATSGLGAAMASALSAAGARVVVTSRERGRARAAAERLGPEALGVALDVRDDAAVDATMAEVWDRLDGLDVLVNNAGIGMRTVNPRFLTDDTPPETRARLLDPAIMGPPIVWLASTRAAGVHDQRIVATEFAAR
jgi:NAD(P)-dependent dehydrogenase (short-subunit alcohol dehydrogenase family)